MKRTFISSLAVMTSLASALALTLVVSGASLTTSAAPISLRSHYGGKAAPNCQIKTPNILRGGNPRAFVKVVSAAGVPGGRVVIRIFRPNGSLFAERTKTLLDGATTARFRRAWRVGAWRASVVYLGSHRFKRCRGGDFFQVSRR